jgi:tetratricopeptide (TPR) repeat protein/membrane protease YdiL (CAAX protease family)
VAVTPAGVPSALTKSPSFPQDRARLNAAGLAIGFGAPFLVGLALLIANLAGWWWPTGFALTRIGAAIFASGAIVVIVERFEGWRLTTVGIRRFDISDLKIGLPAGIGMLAATEVVAATFSHAASGSGSWFGAFILEIRPREISLLSNSPWWLAISAVVALAFSDELIARGYAITRLSAITGGIWFGAAAAVALDLVAHVALWGIEITFCFIAAEAILAFVYLRRRRLWPCVVARVLFGLVVLIPVAATLGNEPKPGVHQAATIAPADRNERAIGNLNQALRDHTGAIALPMNPKTAPEFAHRAQVYWANGQRDKAIADLTTAISLAPKDRELLRLRAEMYGADDDGAASAIADYDRVLALDPGDTMALHQRAFEYHALHNPAAAMSDMNAAIKIAPNDPANYRARGDLYFVEGDNAHAAADIETAMRLDPNNIKTIQMRATFYLRTGQLDRAIADASRIIAIMPESTLGYRIRETAYDSKGDWNGALADVSEIIRREPGNASAYANRAGLELDMGRLGPAREDYEQVAKLDPESLDDLDTTAWALSTSIHPEIRDGKTAVALATKACRLTGWNNSNYLVILAAAYAETRDFAQAVTYQAKAMGAPYGNHDADQMALMRRQLTLYEHDRPYREGDFGPQRMSNAKYLLGMVFLLLILVGLVTVAAGIVKLARYRAPAQA